jgi:hypothetical protein
MKTKIITAAVAASGLMSAAVAQSSASVSSRVPDAPTVADAAVVPLAARADASRTRTGPSQVVYTAQLPSAQQLTDAAAAKGSTILKIEQTPAEMMTTYRFSNGQESVVAYRLLPAAGSASNSASTSTVVAPSAPSIVYVPSPRVVYYDSYPYYYPWYWNPPISVSFGFGYYGGYGYYGGHHHHHYGGHYGYGHGHGHGSHHRHH